MPTLHGFKNNQFVRMITVSIGDGQTKTYNVETNCSAILISMEPNGNGETPWFDVWIGSKQEKINSNFVISVDFFPAN